MYSQKYFTLLRCRILKNGHITLKSVKREMKHAEDLYICCGQNRIRIRAARGSYKGKIKSITWAAL